jgi:hypothetical protein
VRAACGEHGKAACAKGGAEEGGGMSVEICAVVDELVDALAAFGDRVGRDVELNIDDCGILTVMVSSEVETRGEATGFEQAGVFMTIEDVMAYLAMGVL